MCQTSLGNNSMIRGKRIPPLHLRSGSMDIRNCPVMGKFSILTANGDIKETPLTDEENSSLPSLLNIQTEKKNHHICSVCFRFQNQESEEANVSKSLSLNTPPSIFKVLRSATQPAHFFVMSAVVILAILFYPDSKMSYLGEQLREQMGRSNSSIIWPVLYLASFSTLFGAQMWMTFVSGLVLLFILPRHTFACVQSALFPKYMILNGIAAITALIAFFQIHQKNQRSSLSAEEQYQMLGLVVNGLCPLIARVFVVPNMLERIKIKVKLERAAGHGPEAGPKLAPETGELLKQCTLYKSACISFRRLHITVAMINMATLAINTFHLYYIALKLSF